MDNSGLITIDDTFRLRLVDTMLDWLREFDDPRAPDTIAHYEGQRAELVKRIQASNPPPVVVRAKAGVLFAKKGDG